MDKFKIGMIIIIIILSFIFTYLDKITSNQLIIVVLSLSFILYLYDLILNLYNWYFSSKSSYTEPTTTNVNENSIPENKNNNIGFKDPNIKNKE